MRSIFEGNYALSDIIHLSQGIVFSLITVRAHPSDSSKSFSNEIPSWFGDLDSFHELPCAAGLDLETVQLDNLREQRSGIDPTPPKGSESQ